MYVGPCDIDHAAQHGTINIEIHTQYHIAKGNRDLEHAMGTGEKLLKKGHF